MKSLFERINVNANELREGRTRTASEMLANSSYSYIATLKSNFLSYLNKLETHLDLGATSTTDIASNLKNIDAESWVEKLYNKSTDGSAIDIYERYNLINVRIRVHNALFPDLKIEEIDLGLCGGLLGIIVGKSLPEEKEDKDPTNSKESKSE